MNLFSILFFLIFSFSNFAFAEEKTTAQELRALKVTDLDLCNMGCESKFSGCYNNDKKNAIPCAAEVSTCKVECEKKYRK